MGVSFLPFIPNFCRQTLESVSVQADAVYFDLSAILYSIMNNGDYENSMLQTINYLDLFIQKLQPKSFIFIAEEGAAPVQKRIVKGQVKSIAERKVNERWTPKRTSVKFEQELLKKIETDPAWRRPKVIFSSFHTPGEAEQKIFNAINIIKFKNSKEVFNKFVHFIVSVDADAIHLSLAKRIPNAYVLTNINRVVNGPVLTTTIQSLIEDENKFVIMSPNREIQSFHAININMLNEYMYSTMTGKMCPPDNEDELERIISDFELMCFLTDSDFTHDNNFGYDDIAIYREEFYKKGKFLTEYDKDKLKHRIINSNFADFIDRIDPVKYKREEVKRQFDIIYWAYNGYMDLFSDQTFYASKPSKGKDITISQFLRENPDYCPEFEFIVPKFYHDMALLRPTSLPIPMKQAIFDLQTKMNSEGKEMDFKLLFQTLDSVYDSCDQKEKDYYKVQTAHIAKGSFINLVNSDFKVEEIPKEQYIDSLWNQRRKFTFDEPMNDAYKRNMEMKAVPKINAEEAKKLIGKDIFFGWPQLQVGKLCKIIIDDTIIEEDLTEAKNPYDNKDILKKTKEKRGINVLKEKVFACIRPYMKQSMSKNIFSYRGYYTLVPFSLIVLPPDHHPLFDNYKETSEPRDLCVNDEVLVIPRKAKGVVEEILEDGNVKVKFQNSYESDYKFQAIGSKMVPKDKLLSELKINEEEFISLLDKARLKSSDVTIDGMVSASVFPILYSFKNVEPPKEVSIDKKVIWRRVEEKDQQEYVKRIRAHEVKFETEVFSKKDLLWRGCEIPKQKKLPLLNSKVAFIGLTSSIPFGTIGTVCDPEYWRNEVNVIANEPLEYGLQVECKGEGRLFIARKGDLFVF